MLGVVEETHERVDAGDRDDREREASPLGDVRERQVQDGVEYDDAKPDERDEPLDPAQAFAVPDNGSQDAPPLLPLLERMGGGPIAPNT